MAINEITKIPPIPLVAAPHLPPNTARPRSSPYSGANASPKAVVTLQNQNAAMADAALRNKTQPLFTTVNLPEIGNPDMLAALLTSPTIPNVVNSIRNQNLNSEILAAILGNEPNLDLAKLLQNLIPNLNSAEVTATQKLIDTQAEINRVSEGLLIPAPGQAPLAAEVTPAAGEAPRTTAAAVVAAKNLPPAAIAPAVTPVVPAVASAAAAPVIAASTVAPAAVQLTLPFPTPAEVAAKKDLITNPNPGALPVYLVKDPNPPPPKTPDPETDILPTLPITSLLGIGELALRREWEQGKTGAPQGRPPKSPLLEERTIHRLMDQVNEHLMARGLPMRLVLAKGKENYSIDIYDCSGADMCLLVRDIPLNLEELPTLLANLQQESGILLDIKT